MRKSEATTLIMMLINELEDYFRNPAYTRGMLSQRIAEIVRGFIDED